MSQNVPYDLDLFWETCNYGLDFFRDEFAAYSGTAKGLKGFSLRDDDKTGSCYVSKKSRFYLFTDFGANNITPDGKGINAIDYVIRTRNVDFNGACALLFAQFNLPVQEMDQLKPITEFSAKVTKNEGFWNVEYFDEIQDPKAFKRIIPFYTEKLLLEYDFAQVKKYETVGKGAKGLYHMTTTATPEFPIYGYNKKDFAKLYQPFAPKNDKFLHKHSFVGKKPERVIYGWDRVFSLVDIKRIERIEDELKDAKSAAKATLLEELSGEKLDQVIIATGGTDGMNIASLGYDVIWFNSETEVISKAEYNQLKRIANVIYYCPDLDKTGVKQAVAMGMKLPKIKMIWLPESLKTQGKKDVADWIRINKGLGLEFVKNLFKQILSQSVEFQFWKWNAKRGVYSLAKNNMIEFLKYSGFHQYKIENNSADATSISVERKFIHLKDNIVKEVTPLDISDYVINWLKQNFISLDVQEMIIGCTFFSERSGLKSLPVIELNTKTATPESQLFFFNNDAVTVKKDKIEIVKREALDTVTWEKKIIKRDFKLQDAPFRIFTNENGELDIEIFNTDSNYFKVLINTSRIFWQKDIDKVTGKDTHKFQITSTNLKPEENRIQKLQLINKIGCIPHLMHKYKKQSKSYFVLGVDNKIGETTKENNGGSGKSFIVKMIFNYMISEKHIDGRNYELMKSQFILDGVTKETDVIHYEDLGANFDITTLFNGVTGRMTANPKGKTPIAITFEDFAKMVGTMNAVPTKLDASSRRRLWVFECSDYYHELGDDYLETRTIKTDFGKDLYDEKYTADEWANDDNFMMYALQFYLTLDAKIESDGGNLQKRVQKAEIGEKEELYLNEFFSDDANTEDISFTASRDGFLWIDKVMLHELYIKNVGAKYAKSNQYFKKSLVAYFNFKEWDFAFSKQKILGISSNSTSEYFRINKNPDANALQVNEVETQAEPTKKVKTIPKAELFNEPIEDEPATDLPF